MSRVLTLFGVALVLALSALVGPPSAHAASVDPSGVNVRAAGATTVFLTFRDLRDDQRPVEAIWCGEVNPDGSCVAGTVFGRLPSRVDLSRRSGADDLTDIMTIPSSIARRAYQDAERGADSRFYYVRRFASSIGLPDEYVVVTCRMAGGGARTPLALTDVELRFDVDRPVLFVERGHSPAPLEAVLRYNGSGRLRGRFEIVQPGDPQPRVEDLLPEGSLPAAERVQQRRYRTLARFDAFLPPTGEVVLPGPDPARLPTASDGLHLVLLRIEASDERESLSNTGDGVVTSGGLAGFALPVLRYYVGSGEDRDAIAVSAAQASLTALGPLRSVELGERPLSFAWVPSEQAMLYRLEVERAREPVLSALVAPPLSSYDAPPWLSIQPGDSLRWRVIAIGPDGEPVERSDWSAFTVAGSPVRAMPDPNPTP